MKSIRVVNSKYWLEETGLDEQGRKARVTNWDIYNGGLGIPHDSMWRETPMFLQNRMVYNVNGTPDCWIDLQRIEI